MSSAKILFSGLLAAALAACAPNRPAPPAAAAAAPVDYVNAGIYEAADPSNTRLRISLFLSPNHGFILRKTLGKDPLLEYRGEWRSDPDSLRLQVFDVRLFGDRSGGGSDSGRRVVRLDTVIACPIENGAAMPVPLLRLGSPKGGPRLIQMAKPPESVAAWDDEESAKGKGKKEKKTGAKAKKGRNGKDAPAAAPAAAKEKAGDFPES